MPTDLHPLACFATPTLTGMLCERVLKICPVLDVANELKAKRVTDIDDKWAWRICSPCGNSALVFLRVERGYASIARLYTNPGHRRQGLARRLMESVIRSANDHAVDLRLYCQPFAIPEDRAASFASTDLGVLADAEQKPADVGWMMKFYESLGFKTGNDRRGLMTRLQD